VERGLRNRLKGWRRIREEEYAFQLVSGYEQLIDGLLLFGRGGGGGFGVPSPTSLDRGGGKKRGRSLASDVFVSVWSGWTLLF